MGHTTGSDNLTWKFEFTFISSHSLFLCPCPSQQAGCIPGPYADKCHVIEINIPSLFFLIKKEELAAGQLPESNFRSKACTKQGPVPSPDYSVRGGPDLGPHVVPSIDSYGFHGGGDHIIESLPTDANFQSGANLKSTGNVPGIWMQ